MVPPKRTHKSYKNGISWKDNWEAGQFIHQTFIELYGDRYGCGFQRVNKKYATTYGAGWHQEHKGKPTTCVFGRDYTKGQRQCSGSRKRQREMLRDDGSWYYPWIMTSPCGWKSVCSSGAVPGHEARERAHLDHDDCLQGRDAP